MDDVRRAIHYVARGDLPVAVAGGRHAMGGQQFAANGLIIDTTRLDRILRFDRNAGTIEVEAGIQWPELIEGYLRLQREAGPMWGIAQKQTGADRLSLGGALSANVHGRGLSMRPFISDLESFSMIDHTGELHRCSREQDPELFRLAVGGYGLFGVIVSVTLRLVPRRKLQRIVELLDVDEFTDASSCRIDEGFLYGDLQFSIDPSAADFLRTGVFSSYRPVEAQRPMPPSQKVLSDRDWGDLVLLAHTDKGEAFRRYAEHYMATSGQIYWSDTHQLSKYLDGYHWELDRKLRARIPATEVIGELFVPRRRLGDLMAAARDDLRANSVDVIYGTIRLIERDDESVLAWAKESYACVVLNIHTPHSARGVVRTKGAFRRLIDVATEFGGSYYLTYHKVATADQLLSCYPQFSEFVGLKRRYDPDERFASDWYRHYVSLLDL